MSVLCHIVFISRACSAFFCERFLTPFDYFVLFFLIFCLRRYAMVGARDWKGLASEMTYKMLM